VPADAPLTDKERAELERAQGSDRAARRAALGNLLIVNRPPAAAAVVDLLSTVKDAEILCDILRALGRGGVRSAREAVEEFLKDKDSVVRSFAAVCIEDLAMPESIPALLKRAKMEKDTQARKNMLRAAGACGGPAADKEAAKYLLRAIDTEKQNSNKKHAAIALIAYSTDAAKELVVPKLEKLAAQAKDYQVRGGIVYTLAHIGNVATTLPVFEKIVQKVNDEWGKRFMYGAIAHLKGAGGDFGRSGYFLMAEDRDDPARSQD
jgi:HEAT repeat protein